MSDMLTIDEINEAKARGRALERARLTAIFSHPAAKRNDDLARSLTFGTDETAAEIIHTLSAAPTIERGPVAQ